MAIKARRRFLQLFSPPHPSSFVDAVSAFGYGTAFGMTSNLEAGTTSASSESAAFDAVTVVAPNAEVSLGSSSAIDATGVIESSGTSATGTGTAHNATIPAVVVTAWRGTIYADDPPYNVSATGTAANNGAGLRAALAQLRSLGGGRLVLPAGTILVDKDPAAPQRCLEVGYHTEVVGQARRATRIRADAAVPINCAVWGFKVGQVQESFRLAHLTVDGNATQRADDAGQHSMGVWLGGGTNLNHQDITIEDVYITDCDGDAIALYRNIDRVVIDNIYTDSILRDGISVIPSDDQHATNVKIVNSTIIADAQPIDFEQANTAPCADFVIADCTLIPRLNDYAIALGGPAIGPGVGGAGLRVPATDVRVHHCIIQGAVICVGNLRTTIGHNRIVNLSANKSAVFVHYWNDDIMICHNSIDHVNFNGTPVDNAAILVEYSAGGQPQRITIDDNTLTLFGDQQKGVQVAGAVRTAIRRNVIRWDTTAGTATTAGKAIHFNTGTRTAADVTFPQPESVIVADNEIRNPRGRGIYIQKGADVITHVLQIDRNTIIDNQTVSTLTTAVAVDAGAAGPACVVRNNTDNIVVTHG